MNPYYEHAGITIYHGDCRDVLPGMEPADLALTDPPYGIRIDEKIHKKHGKWGFKDYGKTSWDRDRPSADTIRLVLNSARNSIIWGGNYMADFLPPSPGWLGWDKGQRGFSFADFELAWTSFDCAARVVVVSRPAALMDGKVHPTQKSLVVISYCITHADAQAKMRQLTILDPFMGSGTTLRAAKDLGRRAIGIEIEEKYCEIAAKRLSQEILPL
jgi:DNA modification methylase